MKNNTNFPSQDLRKTVLTKEERKCYRYETQSINSGIVARRNISLGAGKKKDSPKILKNQMLC